MKQSETWSIAGWFGDATGVKNQTKMWLEDITIYANRGGLIFTAQEVAPESEVDIDLSGLESVSIAWRDSYGMHAEVLRIAELD